MAGISDSSNGEVLKMALLPGTSAAQILLLVMLLLPALLLLLPAPLL